MDYKFLYPPVVKHGNGKSTFTSMIFPVINLHSVRRFPSYPRLMTPERNPNYWLYILYYIPNRSPFTIHG